MYENSQEWQKIDLEKVKQQYRDIGIAEDVEVLRDYPKIIAEAKTIESSAEYAELMALSDEEYSDRYWGRQDPTINSVKQKLQNLNKLVKALDRRTSDVPIMYSSMMDKEDFAETLAVIKNEIDKLDKITFDEKSHYVDLSFSKPKPAIQNGKVCEDFIKKTPKPDSIQDYTSDVRFSGDLSLTYAERQFIFSEEPDANVYQNLSGSLKEIIKLISFVEGAGVEEEYYSYSRTRGSHTRYKSEPLSAETANKLKQKVQKLVYFNLQKEKEQEAKQQKQGGRLGDSLGGLFNTQSEKGKAMNAAQNQAE